MAAASDQTAAAPIPPYNIYLKDREARAKLGAEAITLRNDLAAREGRPLCEADLKLIPNEQPLSGTQAVEEWMKYTQREQSENRGGLPVPLSPAASLNGSQQNVTAEELGLENPEQRRTVDELRRRRNERFSAWYSVAGLKSHWFAPLLPVRHVQLKRETEEVFHRITTSSGSNSSHSGSMSIFSSPPTKQLTSLSSSSSLGVVDHQPDSKPTGSVLAPVLVWLLSRVMVELFPGLEDSEAKGYAREDITTPTVDLDTVQCMLLVLLEPWCFSAEDAVRMLQEVVMELCLAPTYGHMPTALSANDSKSSFKLPPVLATPSPAGRKNSGILSSSGCTSRASFAATRGNGSTTALVMSPVSSVASPTPTQRSGPPRLSLVGSGGRTRKDTTPTTTLNRKSSVGATSHTFGSPDRISVGGGRNAVNALHNAHSSPKLLGVGGRGLKPTANATPGPKHGSEVSSRQQHPASRTTAQQRSPMIGGDLAPLQRATSKERSLRGRN